MNILVHSDPHISLGGYGIQTKHLIDHLVEKGHRVIVVPKAGLIMTSGMDLDGYKYYPPMSPYGNDGVNALMKKWKPDVLLSNLDPWITDYKNTKKWLAWAPIDHDPIPPDELKKLQTCAVPVALTRYSEKQMRDAGLNPMYCPYGVDTSILYPDENKRRRFRAVLGLQDSDYLIGMVGVNQFARKGYAQAFQAFRAFKEKHPNAYLYVHADPLTDGGLDLFEMGKTIGIDVFFPDLFVYREGFDTDDLSFVYNAFDVYLTTTHSEGFGIPIIEAQACGVPVIATGFMGIPELNPHGLSIDYELDFTLHKSWEAVPLVKDTVRCLEQMYYSQIDKEKLVEFAKQYDFKNIFPLMDEAIDRLYQLTNHEHKWCSLANHSDGELHVPCMVDGCDVGLVVTENKPNEIRPGLYKPEYNGVMFDIEDDPDEGIKKIVIRELPQNELEEIGLDKDSVVIDIGAQVGIVSTYIAKKFGCGVLAIEPMPDNYERLVRNIKAMGVDHLVKPLHKAVYDGKPIKLSRGETNLTGSARISEDGVEVESIALHDIIKCVRFVDCLKIDCEGAEFEILYNLPVEDLKKIKHIRGEFHYIEGRDPKALIEYCKRYTDVKVVLSELTK